MSYYILQWKQLENSKSFKSKCGNALFSRYFENRHKMKDYLPVV
jgi:hypothetical protein